MPCVTSAPAASSQSGEKPNAAIDPSSTTFPAVLRTTSRRGIRLVLVRGAGRGLDAPDDLDRDPQQVLRGRLVQAGAPDEARQQDLGGLVDAASDECEDRPDGALWKREQEGNAAGHR